MTRLRTMLEKRSSVAIVAIVCLMVLEVVALQQHVNGALFSAVTAAIAGIAGYAVQPKRE